MDPLPSYHGRQCCDKKNSGPPQNKIGAVHAGFDGVVMYRVQGEPGPSHIADPFVIAEKCIMWSEHVIEGTRCDWPYSYFVSLSTHGGFAAVIHD